MAAAAVIAVAVEPDAPAAILPAAMHYKNGVSLVEEKKERKK